MKKRIVLILCAILLVAIGATAIFFIINKGRNEEPPEPPLYQRLFMLQSEEDLDALKKEYKLEVKEIDINYVVSDVEAFGKKMTFVFLPDQDNYISKTIASCELAASANDVKSFKSEAEGIFEEFTGMFGVSAGNYYIYSSESVYDSLNEQSLKEILDGKAVCELRIREGGSYWSAKIEKNYNDKLTFTVLRDFNYSKYDDIPVNIDIGDGGKSGE